MSEHEFLSAPPEIKKLGQTTIVGIVPVGQTFFDEESDQKSEGEVVMVICPQCQKPLIEYYCPHNWEQYVSSTSYPVPEEYSMGSINAGNYSKTDRVYCYCNTCGEFAICWNPQNDTDGCRTKLSEKDMENYMKNCNFDWQSFQPQLEWYRVGVMYNTAEGTIFLIRNAEDAKIKGYCLNCQTPATITYSYD